MEKGGPLQGYPARVSTKASMRSCPMCGNRDWEALGLVQLPGLDTRGRNAYALSCENCGFVHLHDVSKV